jgi:hypothetical protein
VEGGLRSILYFPYKAHRDWKPQITTQLGEHLVWEQGIDKIRPVAAVIAGFTWPSEQVEKRCGGPVAVGEVWGLEAWSGGTPDCWPEGITSPVTFELTTDIPGGPISGTGSATVGEAWTTPSPPGPVNSPLDLTFGEEGTGTVDLAKGWKWTAKGQPGVYYSEGTVGPLDIPSEGSKTILCHLQVLITLKVKTTDPDNQPAEAQVKVDQQDGGNWILHSSGDTVEVAGEQVFIDSIPLSPGTYKIRAQAKLGPDPPWVDGPLFPVTPGIELIKSIQVEPGEMPPP